MKKLLWAALLAACVTTSCKKDDSAPEEQVDAENFWKFTVNGKNFSGKFISATAINFIGTQISLTGTPSSGATDTIVSLSVQFPGNKIVTGTYTTASAGTNFMMGKLPSGDIIYGSNDGTFQPGGTIITTKVESYDETTKLVSGSFSGLVYTAGTNTFPLTNGSFKAKLKTQ